MTVLCDSYVSTETYYALTPKLWLSATFFIMLFVKVVSKCSSIMLKWKPQKFTIPAAIAIMRNVEDL